MHRILLRLSRLALSGLGPLALEPSVKHDVHLDGICATFGLVCEACYVYHPHNKLWLVPMRCILNLMFRTAAMPCLYHNVAVLDCYFNLAFVRRIQISIVSLVRVSSTPISVADYGCLLIHWRVLTTLIGSWPAPTVLWMRFENTVMRSSVGPPV